MVISTKYKFIYYAPHKTGSTSIKEFLQQHYNAVEYGSEVDEYPRHHIFLPRKYEDYFTFISVRNPYSRFFSAASYWPETPIERFLKSAWFLPITELIANPTPNSLSCVPVRIDAVVKIEQVEKDLKSLPFINGEVSIPVKNASHNRIWIKKSFYDKIYERFKSDFEAFGYSKDQFDEVRCEKTIPFA